MAGDSFDLIPSGGTDLTPISPSVPTLSPAESWITPTPDFGTDVTPYQSTATAPQLFGQALPAGATPQLATQAINEIVNIFQSDMAQLGFPKAHVWRAVQWFREAAINPPSGFPDPHSYSLQGFKIPAADKPYIDDFLGVMSQFGASEKFVKTALWWINELGQRFSQSQNQPQTRELSDAEWAALERRYADDAAKAEAVLRREWGFQYESNLAIAQRALNNLPKSQREHIANDVLADGTSALNSPDVVMFLFQQAVGVSENMSGGNLAKRIAELEHLMKYDRKAYNDSPELQAELRELYRQRG